MKNSKSVFITGATGSVGKELVASFSNKGYNITIQFNSRDVIARKLAEKYHTALYRIDFGKDFKLPDSPFDIIVNNAGINITADLMHQVTDEDWIKTLRTNLFAPFIIIRKYIPNMMKKKWGRIINISSIYGLRGVENNTPYTVSKHGMSGLTKSIAKEYASYGITCNEICPSAIESEMMNRIAMEESKILGISTKEYLKNVCNAIPAKRMATPKDVADAATFLASNDAAFINGVSLPVDGGMIA
jgi:NAD(P)-dependent dehydrogenase (short-subunit alcohol dehydrogenase family)